MCKILQRLVLLIRGQKRKLLNQYSCRVPSALQKNIKFIEPNLATKKVIEEVKNHSCTTVDNFFGQKNKEG